MRSSGKPLDPLTGTFMAQRFGHDFSRVRVHDDARAAQSAADMNARAWTLGRDIAFGRGEYAPSTPRGAGLLAHELAHVVQQRRFGHRDLATAEVGERGDAYEREADLHASAIASGRRPTAGTALSLPRVQRSALSTFLDVVLFLPRLFGLEVFPEEDLQEYLSGLKQRKGPDLGLFSDNKARACVSREKELGPYDTDTKTWLVEDMLDGWTSFLDEGAIIALLRRSADRPKIVSNVGRDRLWSNFSGQNRRIIEAITLTASDAGPALVSRLRTLESRQIRDYATNASDPAVRESIRQAAALANMTAPVPDGATITAAGEADFTINGVRVLVEQDRINESLGSRAFTWADFGWTPPAEVVITPENASLPMGTMSPIDVSVRIWTEYPSEASKRGTAGYGVGTRPQDKKTLRYHERAHGEAWMTFLRDNPTPVFGGESGMLPAQFNAEVRKFNQEMRAYNDRANKFSIQTADCVGKLPTDEHFRGTGFTVAICHEER